MPIPTKYLLSPYNGSVLKPSCKPILLSTQFYKYLLPLHHEEAPKRLSRNCLYNLT